MSSANYIYGLTAVTAFLRCEAKASNLTEVLLQNLSLAFGGKIEDGIYLYKNFKLNSSLNQTLGFTNAEWDNLEALIDGNQQSKIGIASLIYCFSIYSNIENKYREYYVNKLFNYIYSNKPPKYFSSSEIKTLVDSFSISAINLEIEQSNAKTSSKAINYNFYDSLPLFANLESDSNLKQLIKDSENQYYYLSGELIYDLDVKSTECEKNIISILTPSGEITTTVYRNIPCFEKDSFVGPVSGIKFLRFFNDGPPSSGYFEKDIMEAYIKFDENINNSKDYLSNKNILYSFVKDQSGNYIYLKSGVQIDAQGAFSSTGEYGYLHTNLIYSDEGCEWTKEELEKLPLMRMHQGDNIPKYIYSKTKNLSNECVTGISGPFNWTGFKFVNFELKDSWLKYFDFIDVNPRMDKSRTLKRALNIENDLQDSIIHSPYLNVTSSENGVLECNQYVGPPQLNSDYSSLPGFAFYQTFDNKNFGTGNSEEFSTINIFPTISSGSAFTNLKSNRELSVSSFPIFTGKKINHDSFNNTTKIIINKTFNSSSIADYDDIFKKSIAIGDAFNNQISGTTSLQYNAGYFYTGYDIYKNGEKVILGSLLSEYEDKKIGAKYSKVKYLTGYLDTETDKVYSITPLTAHIFTGISGENLKSVGEYIVYYYFNTNTGAGSILSVNTGWNASFAPIPEGVLQNPSKYSGLYDYQKVENYFPRYYSGPFASYENKFLYPNAEYTYNEYSSFVNGFPYKISYKIKIKEETVREICFSSGFDGSFEYLNVIRAGPSGVDTPYVDYNALTGLERKMVTPFTLSTPDLSLQNKYNFYKNTGFYNSNGWFFYNSPISLNQNSSFVDSFYVRGSVNYWLPEKINNTNYKFSIIDYNKSVNRLNTFFNGVRITGLPIQKKIKISNNLEKTVSSIVEAPSSLYWGYKGTEISGEMFYCPPIFDLNYYQKYINSGFLNVFAKENSKFWTFYGEPRHVFSLNGKIKETDRLYSGNSVYTYNGRDPLFYQYIGGRIGDGAELEGGYNDKGIIGDSWYSFSGERIDGKFNRNFVTLYPEDIIVRDTQKDSYLLLFSIDSGNFNIYTKGLSFYPYFYNFQYKPFISPTLAEPIGVSLNYLTVNNAEYYYQFNLKNYFPFKNVSSEGSFYLESGLDIGPFDRDVELCVMSGNSVFPSGNLIIDNREIAGPGPFYNAYGGDFNGNIIFYDNYVNLNQIISYIAPSTGEAGNTRNSTITTFKMIPKGEKININISGKTGIGFKDSAIVTIRPRTVLSSTYTNNILDEASDPIFSPFITQGDPSYLNIFNYIDNGAETKFSLPHQGEFKNLVGKKFEFQTRPVLKVLYPEPEEDFIQTLLSKNYISYDSYGNYVYNRTPGPTHDYWKLKNPSLKLTGIRDVSKISFEIESIDLEYGDIPYQSQKIIIPSGNCTISGVFAYTGQTESAILSQGLFLTGVTRPSALDSYYSPHYVSDILKRLPEEIQVLPSGSGKYIVLDAPSYAKKRKNYFSINNQSEYENYSPFGLNYNKFIWPALSDLAELNPDIVYEELMPEDDKTFKNSYLFFSASQGQVLFSGVSGLSNPNENATYKTEYLYAFVDSTSTNSSYNTGKCIIKANGVIDTLDSGNLSGILTSEGLTLGLINSFSNL
jgi:hypothetical protein